MNDVVPVERRSPGADWPLRPWFRARYALYAAVAVALLGWSAQRVELGEFWRLTGEAALQAVGVRENSQVGDALLRVGSSLAPLQVETVVPLAEWDPAVPLPSDARIETRTVVSTRVDETTLQVQQTRAAEQMVVRPFGYVIDTVRRMIETVEMGLWATLFGVLLSAPLAFGSASNMVGSRIVRSVCRSTVAFLRSVPELIAALFLVLAYGFGPVAGIVAMGLHCAGFFGKFFADDIENVDPGPQEAVRSTGAGTLLVFRYAVLPQVLPQYVAYVLYIVDRNVRTATVVGLVGAGGIGQELKGRFELFEYQHVATILLVIFAPVLLIEQLATQVRHRLIGSKSSR